jgi:Rieske Fe-S protein
VTASAVGTSTQTSEVLLEQDRTEQDSTLSRRRVVTAGAAAAVGAVGATALAACGGSSTNQGTAPVVPTSSAAVAPSAPPTSADPSLAAVSDVPVGGAISANATDGSPIIISQPKKGDIVAFSAICSHMGCTVAPAGAQLKCPCHGSIYQASDGSVVQGPAPKPLTPFNVTVSGGEIMAG